MARLSWKQNENDASVKEAVDLVREHGEPLPPIADEQAFGAMFDRFADAKVVLLGEASHGTSEFYRARAVITRRLIERHGFTIVAVEADWPDAAAINGYVRHRPARERAEPPFQRFPTWMWRNSEIAALIEWMREHNEDIPELDRRAGFYGLDIYNMSGSVAAVLEYLDKVDPEAAAVARQRYGCLTPWQKDPATYGRAESWNLRDTHMFETLEHLLEARGPRSKAVVWAHNSHIGDARYTEMGVVRDELNIGQLCRERFGEDAALIGFGTHTGTVAAASNWDGPMETMRVRPSHRDSFERAFHDSGTARAL